MKVAAYQAPLLSCGFKATISLVREQVSRCESEGIEILCCPEGILGGLADYAPRPKEVAIDVEAGELEEVLAPLASHTVTSIVGFTETTGAGRLYNTAAVYYRGAVIGLYRKLYPAIRKSVCDAGVEIPVFEVDGLTFGIVICLDSNYLEPARIMAARGATALFVPTNNGLPPEKADVALRVQARNVDIARAVDNTVSVIRADVAGRTENLISYGSSGIVDADGVVLASARELTEELLVADIETSPREPRRGWNASINRSVVQEYARLVGHT